jgi:hypothetical protein
VLLTLAARRAVVIRRGPTRYTAVLSWDLKTDQFQLGQWLHGRIYERRCDLSPDGKHLIYFAANGHFNTSPLRGSWTGISRAPYLKALCVYAKGDCWHGGGLFLSPTEYWLNDDGRHEQRENDPQFQRIAERPWPQDHGGECPGVYYIRLQRDGWKLKSTSPDEHGGQITVFEKPIDEEWILRKHAHASHQSSPGRGMYYDTHELVSPHSQRSLSQDSWEWADVDGERLLWADHGCLHAGRLDATGVSASSVLHDFGPMRFEALEAPY